MISNSLFVPASGISTFPSTLTVNGFPLLSCPVIPFKFSPALNLVTSPALISLSCTPFIIGAKAFDFTVTSALSTLPM